jgi:uncharacterized protein YbaR (Trm112 family)
MNVEGTVGLNAIDPWLLERLVCPLTRAPLVFDPAASELISVAAGLAYPIRDGVPVMLVEAARRIVPGAALSVPASERLP